MPTVATRPQLDQYLSLHEIAARTSFGYSTLRAWISTGRLPAVRVGRSYRVREADVIELLQPVQTK